MIGAGVAAYRFGVMALVEAVLPLTETQVTVVRRIGVIAVLLLGYWLVARFYERRAVTELGFKPLPIGLGAVAGAVLIGLTIASLFALGSYRLLAYRGFAAAWPIVAMIFLAAVLEEVVFRGVLFRLLEKHAGTVKALAVQAVIFGGLHLFNEGTTAVTAVSVTLLGAFWAAIYVSTRNLWVVIANHFTWNVAIFVSGVPLSGQEKWRAAAPFESSAEGPAWLTGGGFGPEDSVLNVLVLAVAFGGLAYRAWRRGHFLSEPR